MDKYEVRKLTKDCFKSGGKYKLSKSLSSDDMSHLIDILWEYMEDVEESFVYKRELEELRNKIKALNDKSGQRVRCIKALPNRRALVQLGPIKEEIIVSPSVNMSELKTGVEVLVIGNGDGRLLAEIKDNDIYDGRISRVQRVIDDRRIVINDGGHEFILKVVDGVICKEGDEIRYELESQMVLEVLGSKESEEFSLLEVPDVSFEDVKGLEEEKKYLQERLIYPTVYREKFIKYGLKPLKAALFHGPPGNGKTMLAGAIFNEMAKLRSEQAPTLKEKTSIKGFFVINGPSVLNKWAGNTEQTIREIFSEARKVSINSGFPSIIFWDEIDSVAGKRKDSATYSPEKTIVPTLLSEIQGLNNGDGEVILLCATNMANLLDPGLMRPGRLGDLILEIPRPNSEAAVAILKSICSNPPKSLQKLINDGLIEKLVSHIYDNKNPLAMASLKSGKKIPLMRQEQVSGALFTQIGEELVRNTCISEIQETDSITIEESIELSENIMLSQIGVLDAGVKSGFTFNTDDYVLDVSLV